MSKVREAFEGKEPSCGGYGSEFRFQEREDGVLVELEAEWAARHCTPSALVTEVDGENVTFQFLKYGEPDGDVRKETVEGLSRWLGEQASEG